MPQASFPMQQSRFGKKNAVQKPKYRSVWKCFLVFRKKLSSILSAIIFLSTHFIYSFVKWHWNIFKWFFVNMEDVTSIQHGKHVIRFYNTGKKDLVFTTNGAVSFIFTACRCFLSESTLMVANFSGFVHRVFCIFLWSDCVWISFVAD